jgi:hypothetical protein
MKRLAIFTALLLAGCGSTVHTVTVETQTVTRTVTHRVIARPKSKPKPVSQATTTTSAPVQTAQQPTITAQQPTTTSPEFQSQPATCPAQYANKQCSLVHETAGYCGAGTFLEVAHVYGGDPVCIRQ